jgi:RimJ/RimL family protein N-acetyltransferase
VAVGSVRCDGGDDGRWRLSWQIAPERRGQGYAPAMLRAAVETLKDEPGLAGAELWAEIKAANIASRRAAAAAGFVCVDEGADVTRWHLTASGSRGIR